MQTWICDIFARGMKEAMVRPRLVSGPRLVFAASSCVCDGCPSVCVWVVWDCDTDLVSVGSVTLLPVWFEAKKEKLQIKYNYVYFYFWEIKNSTSLVGPPLLHQKIALSKEEASHKGQKDIQDGLSSGWPLKRDSSVLNFCSLISVIWLCGNFRPQWIIMTISDNTL